tara:strand:- start:14090 stop:14368 length:279 start_codon:yes stop_codon:yes gene_type:complete
MKLSNQILSTLILLNAVTASAYAEEGMNKQNSKHRGPPAEAIEACENSADGDSCSITTPRNETLEGTCRTPPRLEQLVCAPANNEHKKQDHH